MKGKDYNFVKNVVKNINDTKDKMQSLNDETKKSNNEISDKINKFKKRFKKLEEQLKSEVLIEYINKDEELNNLVYRVYDILKDLDYKTQN